MSKYGKKRSENCSNQDAPTSNKMNFNEDEFPHLISTLDSVTLDTKEYEDIRSPNSNLTLKSGSKKSLGVSSKLLKHPHVSNTESLVNNLDDNEQKTEYDMKNKTWRYLGDSSSDSDILNADECCLEPSTSVAAINNVHKTSHYAVDTSLSNLKFNSNLNMKTQELIPTTFPTPSYQKFDLKVLLEYNIKDINDDELQDYSYALREKAMNVASEFDYFETDKLNFLNDLMVETQSLRTQRLITERMHIILCKSINKLDCSNSSSCSAELHYSYPGKEFSPKECDNFDMEEGYFRDTGSNRDKMYNENKRQGNREYPIFEQTYYSQNFSHKGRKNYNRKNYSSQEEFSGQRNRNSDGKNNFSHKRFLNRGNRNFNRGYLRHEQFSNVEKGNANREDSNCEKYSGKKNNSFNRDCSQDFTGRRKRNSNEKDFSASGKSNS